MIITAHKLLTDEWTADVQLLQKAIRRFDVKRSAGNSCRIVMFEVPRDRIRGTHEAKSFNASRVGGQVHFIVETSDPAELGFFVQDRAAWAAALAPPT